MYNKLYINILLLSSFAMADVLYVPDDYSTIQSAIEAAGNGDSVIVSPGFYTETIDFN